ncbi:MAG: hypothetical protein ACUVWP_08780 [bacterium]
MRTAKVLSLFGILFFLFVFLFSYIRFYHTNLISVSDDSAFLKIYPLRHFDILMFIEMWIIYPLMIISFIGILFEMEWGRLSMIQSTILMVAFDFAYILRLSLKIGWQEGNLNIFSLSYLPFLLLTLLILIILYFTEPLFKEKITVGIIPSSKFFDENIKEVYFKS